MEVSNAQFWMVWRPKGHVPCKQHSTVEAATEQARFITRQHPEENVYVLCAIRRYCVERPLVTETLLEDRSGPSENRREDHPYERG